MFVLEPGHREPGPQDLLCFILEISLPRRALMETRSLSKEGRGSIWDLGLGEQGTYDAAVTNQPETRQPEWMGVIPTPLPSPAPSPSRT